MVLIPPFGTTGKGQITVMVLWIGIGSGDGDFSPLLLKARTILIFWRIA